MNLLNSLSVIVDCVVDQLDDTHPGQKSAIERIVSLAAEEMTRHADVIPTIQASRYLRGKRSCLIKILLLAAEAVLGGPGEALGEVREPRDGRAHRQVPAWRLGALLRRAHIEQVHIYDITSTILCNEQARNSHLR